MIFLGWVIEQRTSGQARVSLRGDREGMPLVFGYIQNKDFVFSFGDRTKNGRVSLRGDREGLPVVRAAAKTMSGLVKPGKNPASNVEKYYCYLPRKISKSNNILDPVEILLRIKGGHCQIPAWSPIRLV